MKSIENDIKIILKAVAEGELSPAAALERISLACPGEAELSHSLLDVDRELRAGFPEAIYAAGKTPIQTVENFKALKKSNGRALATRCPPETLSALKKHVRDVKIDETARTAVSLPSKRHMLPLSAAVLAAGTSDLPVAEEAAVTLDFADIKVIRCIDVGVAGLHRLLNRLDIIRSADVVIVVAGMEGALASVVGGLVSAPVIAVPTSVGYGTGFGGIAALLSMLNACAAGVTVVNIDNGFGAAVAAVRILKRRKQ